ncbi:hypothetical protein V7x_40630 [Crateriforma conspicua]|uniref:Prepilin-type N-terminal cleavage/methylation domain-containing protein n=1 Tax=Crateriforma conspicua TaxID=2527996 RepID=A0A5C6FM25_9PLAN|nr:hypothetical protein V7x_40630 [Crateriforma conspicua]
MTHASTSSLANEGMTLIEVVAGLALMGTLLTLTLVGGTKCLRQIDAARHKRVAVSHLDGFVAAWSESGFDADGVAEATKRSGLLLRGHFGVWPPSEVGLQTGRPYWIHISAPKPSPFPGGSVYRVTVYRTAHEKKRVTWVDVLADS